MKRHPVERIVSLPCDKPKTLEQIRDAHAPSYRRKRLGQHPINGRTLWGCNLECSCGFKLNWNEGKRETERAWREHTMEVWASEKAALQANG